MLAVIKIEQGAKEILVELLSLPHPLVGFFPCVDVFTNAGYTAYRQNITMIEDDKNIPQRFSRDAFNRVAAHIGAALRQFPSPLLVHSTLSANTLARLVQEGIRAKRLFSWRHAEIDESLWALHNTDLGTTRIGQNNIQIGSISAFRRASAVKPIENTVLPGSPSEIVVHVSNQPDTLQHLARLVSDHSFVPMPRFAVEGTTSEQRTALETQYDIVFSPDENNPTLHYIV